MSFQKLTQRNVVDFISAIVLLGVFSYSLYEFSRVLYYFATGDLLVNENLKGLFQRVVFVHSGLITSGFLLIIYALFKKNIVLAEFAIITLVGFFAGIYGWMDTHLHQFLFNSGAYGFLMRDGQSVLNPQYTRIFLYLIAIVVLFLVIFVSKQYRLQRIFILLISSSILFTTIIFHFAVPMGYFKFVRNNALYEMAYEIENKEIREVCRQKNCIVLDKNWEVVFQDEKISKDFMSFYGPQIRSIQELLDRSDINYYKTFLSNFRGNTFDYVPLIIEKTGENVVLITDESLTTGYSRISELVFVSITIVAHLFWYFLGFGLYLLHKSRKVYRLSV